MTDLNCTHLPEGICDGCAEALHDEGTPAPLIVSATELRAWARASHILAEREGFARTAAGIQSYIDLLELAMRSGAHSFELRPIVTPLPAPFGAVRIQVPIDAPIERTHGINCLCDGDAWCTRTRALEAGAADPRQDMDR